MWPEQIGGMAIGAEVLLPESRYARRVAAEGT